MLLLWESSKEIKNGSKESKKPGFMAGSNQGSFSSSRAFLYDESVGSLEAFQTTHRQFCQLSQPGEASKFVRQSLEA